MAVLAAAGCVLAGAGVAQAAWQASGTGSAAARAGALAAPGAGSTSSPTSSSLTLAWSAPTTGATPTGYQVFRDGSLVASGGCGSSTTGASTTTSCVDSGLAADTTYAYTVEAVRGTAPWTGPAGVGFSGKTTAAISPTLGPISDSSGNAFRDVISGNTTVGSGTVTVRFYLGSAVTGTPVLTLTTTAFSGSGSPFAWSVTTANKALAQGSTYTAQASQTDGAGNNSTNQPVVTFTAH